MAKTPCTKQLMNVFNKHNPAAVIAVQETPTQELDRYGVVRYKKGTTINQITEVLEKMPANKAPSNMAQFGRFILTRKVIKVAEECLAAKRYGKDNELWLADLLNDLAKTERIIAQPIEGKWLTTGDPLRYMQTMVEYALARPDLGKQFRKYLKDLNLNS